MSGKYNTQHHRGLSNYPQRLKRRGVSSASVRMESLDTLRKRQGFNDGTDDYGNLERMRHVQAMMAEQRRILKMEGY